MPIDPSLSLQVKTFEPPNPLNQLAQVSQIQAAQRQGELSQMQLDELKNDRLEMQKFQQELAAKGGNIDLNAYADMLLKSPKHMQMGLELKQKLVDQQKYDAYLRSKGVLPAAPMPVAAPAAVPNMLGAEEAVPPPANALAPASAPATNALVAPPVKPVVQPVAQRVVRPADTEESILSDIRALSSSNDPRAKAEVDVLKNKLANLQKGSNLIREYEYAVAHGYKGSLPDFKVLSAPKTTVNMPPQEHEEQKARGGMLVKQYEKISDAASLAAKTLPAIQANLALLNKGLDTGFGTEAKAAGARVLAALGVAGADKLASDTQTFQANAFQALLQKQLEQKGPQTASDAKVIEQTGAQLGSTKDANEFILSTAKAQLERDIEQRNFYNKWWKEHKTYDGAEDAWATGEGAKSLFDRPELKKFLRSESAANQIPGQRPVTTTAPVAIPQAAIAALKAGKGTDAQFDAIFGAGAAKRARGQ